jgi:hypothetical protein
MMLETITYKQVLEFIYNTWAKSFAAIFMLIVGMWVGQIQTESRIIGDCKYAGAFRVDVQAFMCQRRI